MTEEQFVFVLVPSKYNHQRCAFPGCPALRYGDKVEGSHVHHESSKVLTHEELARVRASIDKIVNGIDSIHDRDLRATVFAVYEAHRGRKGVYEIAAEMGLRLPLSHPSSYLSNRIHTWLECAAQNGTLGPFPVTIDSALPICKRCHGKSEVEWRAQLVDTFRAMINNQKSQNKRTAIVSPNAANENDEPRIPSVAPLRKRLRREQRLKLEPSSLTKKQQNHQRRLSELRDVLRDVDTLTLRGWVAKEEQCHSTSQTLTHQQTHKRKPYYIWKAALHAAWHNLRGRLDSIGGELTYADMIRLQLLENCFWCHERFPNGDVLRFDRVDNDSQYAIDNVLPTCNACNQMRGKKTMKEFLEHCERVHKYQTYGVIPLEGPSEHHQSFGAWRNDVQFGRRGKAVELNSEEWLKLWNAACHYCGRPRACGIDRVDSTVKAYTSGNSVSCCGWCNLLKMDLDAELFLRKVSRVVKRDSRTIFATDSVFQTLTDCQTTTQTVETRI